MFDQRSLKGFESATSTAGVSTLDCVTVHDTDIRLFRQGLYPPHRGTMVSLSKTEHLLYTRGSVEYYQTYPGLYVPQPLKITTEHAEGSPTMIAEEILALTKMNWNNTQFDGKYPITLHCARRVGSILKYLASSCPFSVVGGAQRREGFGVSWGGKAV